MNKKRGISAERLNTSSVWFKTGAISPAGDSVRSCGCALACMHALACSRHNKQVHWCHQSQPEGKPMVRCSWGNTFLPLKHMRSPARVALCMRKGKKKQTKICKCDLRAKKILKEMRDGSQLIYSQDKDAKSGGKVVKITLGWCAS